LIIVEYNTCVVVALRKVCAVKRRVWWTDGKEGGRKKFGLGTTRAASEIRGEDNGKKRLGLN
jgi:hypothetical protein